MSDLQGYLNTAIFTQYTDQNCTRKPPEVQYIGYVASYTDTLAYCASGSPSYAQGWRYFFGPLGSQSADHFINNKFVGWNNWPKTTINPHLGNVSSDAKNVYKGKCDPVCSLSTQGCIYEYKIDIGGYYDYYEYDSTGKLLPDINHWVVGYTDKEPDGIFMLEKVIATPTPEFIEHNIKTANNIFCSKDSNFDCNPTNIHVLQDPELLYFPLPLSFGKNPDLSIHGVTGVRETTGPISTNHHIRPYNYRKECNYDLQSIIDTYEIEVDIYSPAFISTINYKIPKYTFEGINDLGYLGSCNERTLNLYIGTPMVDNIGYCEPSRCWCPSWSDLSYSSGIYATSFSKIYTKIIAQYNKFDLDSQKANYSQNKECCSKTEKNGLCCSPSFMNSIKIDHSCYTVTTSLIKFSTECGTQFNSTQCTAKVPGSVQKTIEYVSAIQGSEVCNNLNIQYCLVIDTRDNLYNVSQQCEDAYIACGKILAAGRPLDSCKCGGQIDIDLANHNIMYYTEYKPPKKISTATMILQYYYCKKTFKDCLS